MELDDRSRDCKVEARATIALGLCS